MIDKILSPFEGFALPIIRIASGGLMLTHGIPKLKKLLAGGPYQFPDPLGVGAAASLGLTVFSEVICAALLVIGLKSRWASIPLVITMLVAVFIVHGGDPFKKQEMGLLFMFMYLAVMFGGSGKLSVDYLLGNKT